MSTIRIQGSDLPYNDSDIITFPEGLIGMPHLRRMVLVRQSDIAPFLWLASLDDARVAFLVVEPSVLFPNYVRHDLPGEVRLRLGLSEDETPLALAIVLVTDDWNKSTINLRAPLFLAANAMCGAQIALLDTSYRLNEPLPLAQVAQSGLAN